MASQDNKTTITPLRAGPGLPEVSEAAKGMPPSKAADYIYRIATLTAGIALLMTMA